MWISCGHATREVIVEGRGFEGLNNSVHGNYNTYLENVNLYLITKRKSKILIIP